MELGKKIEVIGKTYIAVYDNTTECDRCDLFDRLFVNCLDRSNYIDCTTDKIVFKLLEK